MEQEIDNFAISKVQTNSKWYLKALQHEIEIGRQSDEITLENWRINNPKILAYKARILGNRNSYKNFSDWMHFLVSEYGPRARCLSLGSGIGRVEKYLVSQGFTERMETIELCVDEVESMRLNDNGLNTTSGDLNFLELPPRSYDFILCHGVLHHLINLEHVLYQINKSLKLNGLFLVYEYVGESRWQFHESRLIYLRKKFPEIQFKQRLPWSIRGFEAVRSGELLGVIQAQFGDTCERSTNFGSVYFPFITTTSPTADDRMTDVIKLDEEMSKDGSLEPCFHMGLYRKNESRPIPTKRWSNDIVKMELSPPSPVLYRYFDLLILSRFGAILRYAKREITLFNFVWAKLSAWYLRRS